MKTDYESRNKTLVNKIAREILLSLWKAHILHHAATRPVVGLWMLQELRRHGYEVSPGTLYPLLHRLERHGWLRSQALPGAGPRARKSYYLTAQGRVILRLVRRQVGELWRELNGKEK